MCYFAVVAEVRQEELVGIFKFALQCNPRAVGGEQRVAVLEVLKMCARLKLQDKFSEELSIMKPHFTKRCWRSPLQGIAACLVQGWLSLGLQHLGMHPIRSRPCTG